MKDAAIIRHDPDIDYVETDAFKAMGFCQSVTYAGLVHYSGIAPLKGALESLEIVGSNDTLAQVRYILSVLDACLKADGIDRTHLVSWTLYTSDMEGLMNSMVDIAAWVGDHRPASTTLAVSGFVHPEQTVEITAYAAAKVQTAV